MVDLADLSYGIDFGPVGGGLFNANSVDLLVEHVADQVAKWENFARVSWTDSEEDKALTAALIEGWQRIRREVEGAPNIEYAATRIYWAVQIFVPVQFNSEAGQKIIQAKTTSGARVAQYIVETLRNAKDFPVNLGQAFQNQFDRYRFETRNISEPRFVSLLEVLDEQAGTYRQDLKTHVDSLRKTFDERAGALAVKIGENIAAAETETATRQQEWDAIKLSYSEQLKLEAPAEQWRVRAEEHDTKAGSALRYLLWTGGIGALVAPLWSFLAFLMARAMFVGAQVAAPVAVNRAEIAALKNAKATAAARAIVEPVLRPTFTYELLFVGTATLLYFTIFIWGLRLLVRNYTTQTHLATDASARAVMATTYLALVKDAAATEADRAIILASLFRPVTDGMVKDDGPPALTPAAVASGILTTRAGQPG